MGTFRGPENISAGISTWTSGARAGIPTLATAVNQRWNGVGGVKFTPDGPLTAFGWPSLRDSSLDPAPQKALQGEQDEVYFSSIGIYSSVRSENGWHPEIPDWQERAARALRNSWRFTLCEEVMDGVWSDLAGAEDNVAVSVNGATPKISNLANGNTIRARATTLPGAVSLKKGIEALIREWRRGSIVDYSDPEGAARGARQAVTPVIHVPDHALNYLPEHGSYVRGREIWTNHGTALIAPGPGYSGNPPGTAAPTDMPAGNFWIYVTGPLAFDVSTLPAFDDFAEEFDERTNTQTPISEMNAIAIFDPTVVYGIEVVQES